MTKLTKEKIEIYNDRFRFGGNRIIALQRDNYQCVKCGMSQEQHTSLFGTSLTVDHIDKKGKNVSKIEKNNNLDNLQTLCYRCHANKDNDLVKARSKRWENHILEWTPERQREYQKEYWKHYTRKRKGEKE